jgi:hypothetical protein
MDRKYDPFSSGFIKNILKDNSSRLSESSGLNYLFDKNITEKIIMEIPENGAKIRMRP